MVKKRRRLSKILRILFISHILIAISSGMAFSQTVILNQGPNQSSSSGSDIDSSQSVAENFIVSSAANITQIRIWGAYFNTGTAPPADYFTVIFHDDSAGLPGTAISTQNNVPVIRQATGEIITAFSLAEYVYTLTLTIPVNLTPGTYWVEIYNDTTTDVDDNFVWETGTVDPIHGIPNIAASGTVPGNIWVADKDIEFAIEITKESTATAVPTMSEWGMIIFMALAGFGATYYLRKQKTAKS